MSDTFHDQAEAGRLMARELRGQNHFDDDAMIVAAGIAGVPLAVAMADELDVPVDVIQVQPVRRPTSRGPEIGATSDTGSILIDDVSRRAAQLARDTAFRVARAQLAQTVRTSCALRLGRSGRVLTDAQVIVAAEFDPTGLTTHLAAVTAHEEGARHVTIATPAMVRATAKRFSRCSDRVLALAGVPSDTQLSDIYAAPISRSMNSAVHLLFRAPRLDQDRIAAIKSRPAASGFSASTARRAYVPPAG